MLFATGSSPSTQFSRIDRHESVSSPIECKIMNHQWFVDIQLEISTEPPTVIAVWLPITWQQTIVIASA